MDDWPLSALLRSQCIAQRQEKLRLVLRERGLEALIAYGNGRHSFLAFNPAWFLTGFRQLGPHMAVILPVSGDPFVIMTPVWDRSRLAEQLESVEIIGLEPDEFLPAVRAELQHRGMQSKRIAVAEGSAVHEISAAWADMLSQPPIAGDKLVSDIAKIRDEWSLACVSLAAAIAEKGWHFGLEKARASMAEYQLAAEMEAEMRRLGAEDNFQLLSASQHNKAAHRPSNRILERGDVLLGEVTPAVAGEYVQICRTAVLGEPTARQRELFALLDGALREAMRAARPGTPARDIVRIMNAPIIAAGYEAYTKPPYMRTRGHSMALGSMDPEIAADSGQVLQDGMVFVLHPNQYLPDTGYLMCGEPVIIRPDGAQALTSQMGELGCISI
jgi:Xaa-Pro dipeptidase